MTQYDIALSVKQYTTYDRSDRLLGLVDSSIHVTDFIQLSL